MPPTKVTSCFTVSIGVSVATDWMTVTSFINRDSSSPVRRRAKKLTVKDCIWLNSCLRKSATMVCETDAVR